MTRTLTQQASGIYTANNLSTTDWDHVLSNFATIAASLPYSPPAITSPQPVWVSGGTYVKGQLVSYGGANYQYLLILDGGK